MNIEPLESRVAPATIFAVDVSNNLLSFDSATPGTVVTIAAITGLTGGAGEIVEAIDFRPATGQLYALGIRDMGLTDEARIYVIDPLTAKATQVGTGFTVLEGGTNYGFDFNPTSDRLRVVNDADENARFIPDNGARADTPGNDTNLDHPTESEEIIASAYDRNFASTVGNATTLYAIDFATKSLVIQGGIDANPNPNGGLITTIGSLNVTLDSRNAGFDIANATGTAFASLTVGGTTGLYTIDLATGTATLVGAIGAGTTEVRGLAVALPAVQILTSKTATYMDENGDRVTIKVTKGTLDASDFQLAAAANGGGQLRLIDFSDDDAEFEGTNLTLTVKKARNGDGLAHVGFIKARDTVAGTGVDLGNVSIPGDLGQIDAGDADTVTAALAKLSVRSMGRFGFASQATGASTQSDILGPLGVLKVKGDVTEVMIKVEAASLENGTIGSVIIGGSLLGGTTDFSGLISATGNIGPVKIGRDIIGGAGTESGRILSSVKLGAVTVGGSVLGGSGDGSGTIVGLTEMAAVKIRGDLAGGDGHSSGRNFTSGKLASATIGGSVLGHSNVATGTIFSTGDMGPVRIGRDLVGGDGTQSGRIQCGAQLTSVTIGGSVLGSSGGSSGTIVSVGDINSLNIGRDLIGGSITGTASLFTSGAVFGQRIGAITIGGSIISGTDDSTGTLSRSGVIQAFKDIGSLTIKGNIIGNATNPVLLTAHGQAAPGPDSDIAIGKIVVGGRVERAQILAGWQGPVATNGNASIGRVNVGGDWIASDLVAGVQDDDDPALDDSFGDADDIPIPGFDSDGLVARIASISIKGVVIGSALGGTHGFVAQQIGSFKALGFTAPLTAGTDGPIKLSPITDDVTIREV
jgi:hypothetical protein